MLNSVLWAINYYSVCAVKSVSMSTVTTDLKNNFLDQCLPIFFSSLYT